MICYDLETAIMGAGIKREQQLILEIGACDAFNPSKTFHCFVNPSNQLITKSNFMDVFVANGAREYPTKRHAFNIGYDPLKAIPLRDALIQFLTFINQTDTLDTSDRIVLCAHNGKAFDDRIVSGSLQRTGLKWPEKLVFLDSYREVAKKTWIGKRSYKLQNLHRNFCPENSNLKWHTALDDTLGLQHVVAAAARHTVCNRLQEAVQFIETTYAGGIQGFNGDFSCKLPNRLSNKMGRYTKAALKKKIMQSPPSTKITNLCLVFALTLWT